VTPDRHDAADPEPAALEPAPGEHAQEFLPPAEQEVTAGDRPGWPVTVKRAGTASGPGSGPLHVVPCYLLRRQG
jgi:hypothetical protein